MNETLRSRYTWLLAGLLSMALVLPLTKGDRVGLLSLQVISVALIATCIAAVMKRRRQLVVALALALPSIAMSVVALLGGDSRVAALRDALQTTFAAYTALVILGDVVREERVTAEKIRGAVCVCFMIGATWAFAYATLIHLDPSAISFPSGVRGESLEVWASRIGEIFYFSYSTLTTVGYGDVLAVSPVARSLAWLEAVVGQIYLAVLVARLVGLHIAQGIREG